MEEGEAEERQDQARSRIQANLGPDRARAARPCHGPGAEAPDQSLPTVGSSARGRTGPAGVDPGEVRSIRGTKASPAGAIRRAEVGMAGFEPAFSCSQGRRIA